MNPIPHHLTAADEGFLSQCVALAREAYEAGDNPFGSVLVDENNTVLATARNRSNTQTITAHPEKELAQWALENMSREQRRKATLYTSGEHCPMCAGAHAFSEIGRLVFLSAGSQYAQWRTEAGMPEAPIRFISTKEIIQNVRIEGPFAGPRLEAIKQLQLAAFERERSQPNQ